MKLFSSLLKKGWEWAVLAWATLVLVTFVISVALPGAYKAESQVLVVQKLGYYDRYSREETVNYVSHLLTDVVQSESFYSEVITRDPSIQSILPKDEYDRRKEWKNMVEIHIVSNGGILRIDTFHVSPSIAKLLNKTIADTLIQKGNVYHGAGESIEIKAIDAPLVSRYPVRPNVLLNVGIAIVVGFFISFGTLTLVADFLPDWTVKREPHLGSGKKEEDDLDSGFSATRPVTLPPLKSEMNLPTVQPAQHHVTHDHPIERPAHHTAAPMPAQPKKKWGFIVPNPKKLTVSADEIEEQLLKGTPLPMPTTLPQGAPNKEALMANIIKENPATPEQPMKDKMKSWIETGHF